MIAALTFLTILATALFGVFGSLVDFRDKDGRITRNGWIGLTGVIVAGIAAGALQVYSDVLEEESTLTILKQNSEILADVNRTLHPLPGLTVSYKLRPDWTSEHLNPYFAETEAAFAEGRDVDGMMLPPSNTSFGTHIFPPHDQHPELSLTVCSVELELFVFRKPIDVSSFEYDLKHVGEDLRIDVRNPCDFDRYMPDELRRPSSGRYDWDFGQLDGQLLWLDLKIRQNDIDSTSDAWLGNSTVSSLHDLLGAQLIIQLTASGHPVNPDLPKEEIDKLRKSVELSELIIRLENGVVLHFDHDNLITISDSDEFARYMFLFPSTMQALVEAVAYNRFKKLEVFD